MKITQVDKFTFTVETKYGEVAYDKRIMYANYEEAVEIAGSDLVNAVIAGIDQKEFVNTNRRESCGRHKPEPTNTFGNYTELLDFYSDDSVCGKPFVVAYYVGRNTYQNKVGEKIVNAIIDKYAPELRKYLKVTQYGIEYGNTDVYINSLTAEKTESLYVPLKAIVENDFSIAEKRMIDYNKSTGYCSYNSFKDEPYAKLAKQIINREPLEDLEYIDKAKYEKEKKDAEFKVNALNVKIKEKQKEIDKLSKDVELAKTERENLQTLYKL